MAQAGIRLLTDEPLHQRMARAARHAARDTLRRHEDCPDVRGVLRRNTGDGQIGRARQGGQGRQAGRRPDSAESRQASLPGEPCLPIESAPMKRVLARRRSPSPRSLVTLSARADAGRARRRTAGACRARAGAAPPRQHRHLHGGHGASRRREQRAAGDAQSRSGLPHGARDGDARATAARTKSAPRSSRRWACCGPRSLPRCIGSTAPNSTSRAPSTSATRSASTRRSRSGARDEIIGDYVRLIRTIRPDVIFGMSPTGDNGGPAPQRVGGPLARGVQAGRRPDQVPRADQGRPAALAAEEVLLLRGVRPASADRRPRS